MSQRMHNLEGGKALINKALPACMLIAYLHQNCRLSCQSEALPSRRHPESGRLSSLTLNKEMNQWFGKDWIQEGLLVQWMPPSGGLLSFPSCPRGTSQPRKVWRSTLEFLEQSLNMCTLIPFEKLQSAAVLELPDCLFLTPPTALEKQN